MFIFVEPLVGFARTKRTLMYYSLIWCMEAVSDYRDCTLITHQNIRYFHLRWTYSKWNSLLSNRLYTCTCWSFALLFFFCNRWWNPGVNPYVYVYLDLNQYSLFITEYDQRSISALRVQFVMLSKYYSAMTTTTAVLFSPWLNVWNDLVLTLDE